MVLSSRGVLSLGWSTGQTLITVVGGEGVLCLQHLPLCLAQLLKGHVQSQVT